VENDQATEVKVGAHVRRGALGLDSGEQVYHARPFRKLARHERNGVIAEPLRVIGSGHSLVGGHREKDRFRGCGVATSGSLPGGRLFIDLRLSAWRFVPVRTGLQPGSLWMPAIVAFAAPLSRMARNPQ